MSRRTRVYVSGPISTSGDWKQNMKVMYRAGMELRRLGYAPFVPAAGPASAIGKGMTHEAWLECDFPYVEVADAVLRLPGDSRGADEECALADEIGVPVFGSIEELCAGIKPTREGDMRFHRRLHALGRLHDMKQEDYGSKTDPFANVRASEDFGVAPWVGALVRLNDKVTRLKNFARKGQLANESARDSMMDISVYAVIADVLYEEETGA